MTSCDIQRRACTMLLLLAGTASHAFVGCAAGDPAPTESVANAWQHRDRLAPVSSASYRPRANPSDAARPRPEPSSHEPAIATVNGQTIGRAYLVELILRSHGAALLEQLVGLETARLAAAEKGVTVTSADVDREYDGALRRLSDPLAAITPAGVDRAAAEPLLDAVLRERNLSRAEFDLVIRRNAFLRKIVTAGESFSEGDLRREYERLYGRRMRVRHIQVATLGEVERLKERLAAGEEFAELASRYSANSASAANGGLLDPFSWQDDDVPAIFRETAFALQPGQVSDAVRVGSWFHLIQLDAVLPAEQHNFDEVRPSLVRSLQERVTEPKMFELFEKLFRQATIEIHDPALHAAFEKRFPDRTK